MVVSLNFHQELYRSILLPSSCRCIARFPTYLTPKPWINPKPMKSPFLELPPCPFFHIALQLPPLIISILAKFGNNHTHSSQQLQPPMSTTFEPKTNETTKETKNQASQLSTTYSNPFISSGSSQPSPLTPTLEPHHQPLSATHQPNPPKENQSSIRRRQPQIERLFLFLPNFD